VGIKRALRKSKSISQGLKPAYGFGVNAKAEALAYLEAKARNDKQKQAKARSRFPSGMTNKKHVDPRG
jgi:hypothetical protein